MVFHLKSAVILPQDSNFIWYYFQNKAFRSIIYVAIFMHTFVRGARVFKEGYD